MYRSPLGFEFRTDHLDIALAVEEIRTRRRTVAGRELGGGRAIDAVDHAAEPGDRHRAGTHRTGLGARIHRYVALPVVVELPGGPPRELQFGMGGDVLLGASGVPALGDYLAVSDQQRSEGGVSAGGRLASEFECPPEVSLVDHGRR